MKKLILKSSLPALSIIPIACLSANVESSSQSQITHENHDIADKKVAKETTLKSFWYGLLASVLVSLTIPLIVWLSRKRHDKRSN